jgi:hypothetical protein
MLNKLAQLPHLWKLEFISAINLYVVCGNHLATRKAIQEFLPDGGVYPYLVTSHGLDYKLRPVEEKGKTCWRYTECGPERAYKDF